MSEMKCFSLRSRGIGRNWIPCFVCGKENEKDEVNRSGVNNDLACFVDSKGEGEAIVKLFNGGAKLDFREHRPDYVQVKIGACDKHLPNLEKLREYISSAKSICSHKINIARISK